ncbi:hypothetical protein ANCCEY_11171 [Ancylostoma ceylanicum]|uniref:G-protein coupled receptors family 1 profile domain-containing protein n=1 Tax=Ancylostoma ceylanicum TaxID=53326 RepID=A0A0D6LPZ3_9BILA|nr:hypothetical protein ANCCEY_11171 [Ancylostoma ceylanicum]
MEMLDGYPDLKTMDIVAGVIMIVLGIAGSLINVTVIVLMVKTTQFQNAFGYVCISQLVADTFELLINIFWTGPSTLLALNASITNSYAGNRVAQFALFFWFVSIYSHLLIAINRMMAIAWPLSYR